MEAQVSKNLAEALEASDPYGARKLMKEIQEREMVNHPDHYQGNKMEVIDIIEDYNLGFSLGIENYLNLKDDVYFNK